MRTQDERAIPAFHKAVSLNPALLGTWLHLAASYANENARPEAFHGRRGRLIRRKPRMPANSPLHTLCCAGDTTALESWLANHSKYKALLENASNDVKNDSNRHRALVTLMLQAVRQSQGPDLDTDVQVNESTRIKISDVERLAHVGLTSKIVSCTSHLPRRHWGYCSTCRTIGTRRSTATAPQPRRARRSVASSLELLRPLHR